MSTVLVEPGVRPRYVYFVTSGMVSQVTTFSNGQFVEVGLVSREGVVGAFNILGPPPPSSRSFVQIPGTALRMSLRHFELEFGADVDLRRLVLRYVQYTSSILGQLAACNRLHEVEARLARWLLMVQDRIGDDDLPLTQEFLSAMLGARRSTLSVTASAFQRSGIIEYRRGKIRILDRDALEKASCECYDVTRRLLVDLYK